MTTNRILGAAVFAIGVILLVFAYRAANAPMEQLTEAVTGRYSNDTMWFFAAGVAALVGGGLLAVTGGRR